MNVGVRAAMLDADIAVLITVYVLTSRPSLRVQIRLDLQEGHLRRQEVDPLDLGFSAIIPTRPSMGLQGG